MAIQDAKDELLKLEEDLEVGRRRVEGFKRSALEIRESLIVLKERISKGKLELNSILVGSGGDGDNNHEKCTNLGLLYAYQLAIEWLGKAKAMHWRKEECLRFLKEEANAADEGGKKTGRWSIVDALKEYHSLSITTLITDSGTPKMAMMMDPGLMVKQNSSNPSITHEIIEKSFGGLSLEFHHIHCLEACYQALSTHFQGKLSYLLSTWKWPFPFPFEDDVQEFQSFGLALQYSLEKEEDVSFLRQRMKQDKEKLLLTNDFSLLFNTFVHLELDFHFHHPLKTAGRLKSNASSLKAFDLLTFHYKVAFKYHFRGERPTNQLDRPEYYLAFIRAAIDKHNEFCTDVIQPILEGSLDYIALDGLSSALPNPPFFASSSIESMIATHELIKSLISSCILPKLQKDIPRLMEDMVTFVHTLVQLSLFDYGLLETYSFSHFTTTWALMNSEHVLDAWTTFEFDAGCDKLRSVLKAETRFESISFERSMKVIPSVSSQTLTDYFYETKEFYIHIPRKLSKRFLQRVILPVFVVYLESVKGVVSTFQNNFYPITSSTDSNNTKGGSGDGVTETPKTKDFRNVAGIFNGINHILTSLFWTMSNEESYIMMDLEKNVFEEIIESYEAGLLLVQDCLVNEIFLEFQPLIYAYERLPWGTSSMETSEYHEVSQEVFPALAQLNSRQKIIQILSPPLQKRVVMNLARLIDGHLNESILVRQRNSISHRNQMKQLQCDIKAIAYALKCPDIRSSFPKICKVNS